jgi:predicted enzyme related to lactoylglutathione lyase
MPPTLANGKICYVELPATDIQRSADFYAAVFGWRIGRRGDGSTSFDDTVSEVSGTWVLGRPPATGLGLLLFIMVKSVEATVELIKREGGKVEEWIEADTPEIARFYDPAGNLLGLYQEPSL